MDETSRRAQDWFGPRAEAYARSPSHGNREDLDRMCALVGRGDWALDVATGGGHTARALAGAFASVVSVDATVEMLRALESSLRPVRAEAGFLPFAHGSFDLVASRIAPHHFPDLDAFVREAALALRPGGRFYAFDLTTPEDPETARAIDAIERLRDPTHVASYPPSAWRRALRRAGLAVERVDASTSTFPLDAWIDRARLEAASEARLRARLSERRDLGGYGPTAEGRMCVLRVEVLARKG